MPTCPVGGNAGRASEMRVDELLQLANGALNCNPRRFHSLETKSKHIVLSFISHFVEHSHARWATYVKHPRLDEPVMIPAVALVFLWIRALNYNRRNCYRRSQFHSGTRVGRELLGEGVVLTGLAEVTGR